MLFFKFEVNNMPEKLENFQFQNFFDTWNTEHKEECIATNYGFRNLYLEGVGVCKEYCNIEAKVEEYLKANNIKYEALKYSEITSLEATRLFRRIGRNVELGNRLEKIGIGEIIEDEGYDEVVINEKYTKEDLLNDAKNILCYESLSEEINRIYSSKASSVRGIPVHYLIAIDDKNKREEVAKILAKALIANNRIKGNRLTFDPYNNLRRAVPGAFTRDIYNANKDGIICIEYDNKGRNGNDGETLSNFGNAIIEALCNFMKKNKNDVLTIFAIQNNSKKVINSFKTNLAGCHIIEIKEDVADYEAALRYLNILAQKRNIKIDDKIKNMIKKNSKYTCFELDQIFDSWFSNKLNKEIYPEYSNIKVTADEITKINSKGSAYDELSKLIGLKNAKEVIDSAIDYYKAQKLFADKGMKKDNVSMHMVFTGNPGTAKTTVARLFAKIMAENGILSKGNLYEVGRSDLVGMYVGHTAPQVKRAFEEAKGSVLFIDEAYSLVDDRDGLYGDEAINTIVQEMENNREDLIVIFAGYPKQMEQFIDKNPGLKSRIAFTVPFDDYNPNELCQIATHMAKEKDLYITSEALKKLETVFNDAVGNKDFGNGRFVRNAIEKAQLKQASRLIHMNYDAVTPKILKTLTLSDFEGFKYNKTNTKRIIGF